MMYIRLTHGANLNIDRRLYLSSSLSWYRFDVPTPISSDPEGEGEGDGDDEELLLLVLLM